MKGILLLTMSLLLIAGCSMSQKPSLAEIEEIDSLLDLAYDYNSSIDPNNSLKYSLEALAAAQSSGYSKGIAESCFYISLALHDTGNYFKSMEYISYGEKYVHGDPKLKSEFMRIKARIYSYLGLQEKAKEEFLNGLAYVKKIKQREQQQFLTALAYENLAHLYRIIERPDSSLFYTQKKIALLNVMEESRIYTILVNAYTSMARFKADDEQYDSARIYFDKALAVAGKYNYPYLSRTYTYKGDIFLQTNNVDSALYYYDKALDNLGETGLKAEYPLLYEKISDIYLSLNDTITARQYEKKNLIVEKELDNEKLNTAQNILSTLISKEKEIKQAQRKKSLLLGTVMILLLTAIIFILFFMRQKKINYYQEQEKAKEQEQKIQTLTIKVNESLAEIVQLARKNDPSFMVRFQEIYPEFAPTISTYHPQLQLTELQLLALIYLQFTTKEIADCTCRSVRTVQNRKYRLRKKLGIATDIDINIWLNEIFQ
jgi:DNA-binding CsgD family transcriptional regulator